MAFTLPSALKAAFFLFSYARLARPAPAGTYDPVDNAWQQETGGPIVLDNPSGVAASGPSATGHPYGSTSLQGYDGNSIDTADDTRVPNPSLVPAQKYPADDGLYLDLTNVDSPQPIRGSKGGTDPGSPGMSPSNDKVDTDTIPDTSLYNKHESDAFAPPGSGAGSLPQFKWPLGLSHNHLGLNGSGWARQENTAVLPAATEMAGLDMRLSPHTYRELHWRTAGKWSFIITAAAA